MITSSLSQQYPQPAIHSLDQLDHDYRGREGRGEEGGRGGERNREIMIDRKHTK